MAKKRSTKSNNSKTKKGGRKGGVSMMATGAGLVVGGALGAAAGALLADEKRRDKIVEKAQTLSSQAADAIEDVSQDARTWRDRAYESLEGAQEETDRVATKAKKAVRKS